MGKVLEERFSMISEIEIQGFKSFGSPGEKIKLQNLNFLVGANASGKTNFINALKFIKNGILRDFEFAVEDLGGVQEICNKLLHQKKDEKHIRIKVRFLPKIRIRTKERTWNIASFDYMVLVNLGKDNVIPEIVDERFFTTFEDHRVKKQFKLIRNKMTLKIQDPIWNPRGRFKVEVPHQEKSRSGVGVGFFAPPCTIFRDQISGWKFFNINPETARIPCRELSEPELGHAGENLAVILHKLEQKQKNEERKDFDGVVRGLTGVVPGFKGIKTTQLPIEGKWAFQVIENELPSPINPNSVSDGTIRLMTLLAITTFTAEESTLIAIEEPENGLHPHLAEHVIEILKKASKKRQLLITTHNPDFLDHLDPKEIILCDKKNGFTKIKTASSIREIKKFQKHFSLGELWVQGPLGGIP